MLRELTDSSEISLLIPMLLSYTCAMDFPAWDLWNARWVFTIGFVLLLLSAEWIAPFRIPTQSKLEHVSINLVIFGGNSLILQFLAAWVLLLWSGYVGSEGWGLLHHLRLGPVANILLSIVLLDLVAYSIHRFYHRVPFCWRFHRAHHSDLDMDATTSIRFHLGEVVVTMSLKGLSVTALGIPPVGFLISETLTLGAGLFSHANVRLPRGLERALRLAIVTPAMHWIHHSRRPVEHNANLGAVFSGWDRWFGTYHMGVGPHEIQFGLDDYPAPQDVTLLRFCRMPFDGACRRFEHETRVSAPAVAPVKLH
jgi:sterol desaturase/sphingolipid hydroxylase (fatty acid hydroxylase superfamily)